MNSKLGNQSSVHTISTKSLPHYEVHQGTQGVERSKFRSMQNTGSSHIENIHGVSYEIKDEN